MAGFLVIPTANADDVLTGAVLDTTATTPQTITGLTNGTEYEAYAISDASTAFTPAAASSPSATLIHSSENVGFSTVKDYAVGTLSAGDYIAFVMTEQSPRTYTVTLEGSAMTALTGAALDDGSLTMNAFYINGIAGGGDETLQVTLNTGTANVMAILVKISDGTIVTTVVTDTANASPPDLDLTFANSADELMVVGWIHQNIDSFSSYDSLTALQAATNSGEGMYGCGSGSAVSGSPDTVGINFTAGFARAIGVGVRVT